VDQFNPDVSIGITIDLSQEVLLPFLFTLRRGALRVHNWRSYDLFDKVHTTAFLAPLK
jgi:hypothetical protein